MSDNNFLDILRRILQDSVVYLSGPFGPVFSGLIEHLNDKSKNEILYNEIRFSSILEASKGYSLLGHTISYKEFLESPVIKNIDRLFFPKDCSHVASTEVLVASVLAGDVAEYNQLRGVDGLYFLRYLLGHVAVYKYGKTISPEMTINLLNYCISRIESLNVPMAPAIKADIYFGMARLHHEQKHRLYLFLACFLEHSRSGEDKVNLISNSSTHYNWIYLETHELLRAIAVELANYGATINNVGLLGLSLAILDDVETINKSPDVTNFFNIFYRAEFYFIYKKYECALKHYEMYLEQLLKIRNDGISYHKSDEEEYESIAQRRIIKCKDLQCVN